jgi:hypothetical protein
VKRRHHFVPKFYLRAFASAPRRIHVFNLSRGLAIENASIRDQSYQHRLYGPDDELEDAFAVMEGRFAEVVREVLATSRPPDVGSEPYRALVTMISLQMLRTTGAIARVRTSSRRMAMAAFEGTPPPELLPSDEESLALSLRNVPLVSDALCDLKPHVLLAQDGCEFLTSDNPVFRYNQYCEGVPGMGVTGAACRGLQTFLPLSPSAMLLLYDGAVYKVGSRNSPTSLTTPLDVWAMNQLQVIAAERNIYFANWATRETIPQLLESARKQRSSSKPRVQLADEVGAANSMLVHQYDPMPNLRLQLSAISIRRNARRVDLFERCQLMRKPFPGLGIGSVPQPGEGLSHRFRPRRT